MPGLNILLALMALQTGGAETHVVGLAEQLKKNGHRVITASQGGCLELELAEAGVEHYTMPLSSRAPWDLLTGLNQMIRLAREQNIDLIHAHARIPAWVGHFTALVTKKPLVTTAHGIYSVSPGLKLLTAWGDQVIAVSRDVKAHVVENFGVPAQKITVIPNGVDTERFSPQVDPQSVLSEFGLAVDSPKLVYISRLSGARGEVALKVAEAVPELLLQYADLQTLIVGEGDKLAEVRQRADAINRQYGRQAIVVTGARTDTAQIIAAATVVIGVGRVILEGMASAKPVIIAGEAGFMGVLTPDLLPQARRHNFSGRGSGTTTDALAIAAAARAVFSGQVDSAALACFGRETVINEFSLDQMAAEVQAVYYRALGRKNDAVD